MITITDAERKKWESGQYRKSLTISFPNINAEFPESLIYSESMVLKESLFDGNGALDVFGCVSSSFSVNIRIPQLSPSSTLYPSDDLYPGQIETALKGQYIEASIRISTNTKRKIFRGYVDSVETMRSQGYMKLQCYDKLHYYADRNVYSAYATLGSTFTVKQLRNKIMQALGISQKAVNLPNDNVVLSKTYEGTELAFIDAVKAICQMNGVFGLLNRSDSFEYRQLSYFYGDLPFPSDNLFPSNDLYPANTVTANHDYIDAYESMVYEDYEVEKIGKVIIRDSSSDTEYGEYGSGSNAYVIENIFLKGLSQATKTEIATGIYSIVKDITYRPFTGVALGRPYMEVGDAVSYYVYNYNDGGTQSTTVMTFNILSRVLKGIQWLRDEYTASGSQYQPIVKFTLPDKVDALEDDVKQLEEDIKGITTEVEDISGDISDIQDDIGDIKDDVSGITDDIEDIKDNVSDLSDNVSGLSDDVSGMSDDISDIKDDVTALQDTTTQQGNSITALQGDVADLQGLITISNVDIGVGAPLDSGHVYLVYE